MPRSRGELSNSFPVCPFLLRAVLIKTFNIRWPSPCQGHWWKDVAVVLVGDSHSACLRDLANIAISRRNGRWYPEYADLEHALLNHIEMTRQGYVVSVAGKPINDPAFPWWTSGGSAAVRNGPWIWLEVAMFGQAACEQRL